MLNPPNPLGPSHPRGALNFQDPQNSRSIPRETLQAPRAPNPFDPLRPSGDGNTQSAGLTGESLLCKAFDAVQVQMEPKLVFLIMSFHGDGVDEVEATVRQECDSLGFSATRVDDAIGSDFVIKEIWQHIEKAELIVCDLTYERPNVYYELGYAHGVGNSGDNILLIAREETTLHFDVGPLRVHYYSSMEILRTILQKNLPEMHRVTTLKQPSKSSSQSVQTPKKRQALRSPDDVRRKKTKTKGRH